MTTFDGDTGVIGPDPMAAAIAATRARFDPDARARDEFAALPVVERLAQCGIDALEVTSSETFADRTVRSEPPRHVPLLRTADHAAKYAARGWQVWPIRPRSKRPHTEHGSADASADPEQVARWWRMWPHASIGAIVPDGLVVLDLDPRNGCPLTPDDFPATWSVRTGGGGWHLWFRAPGVQLAGSVDRFPGLDVLRAGRGVIVPRSLHPSGTRYEWVRRDALARLPAWWVDRLRAASRETSATAHRAPSPTDRYVEATRLGVVDDLIRDCVEGQRNATLYRAARRYADVGLGIDDALADLLPIVLAAGLDEREAVATIRSAHRR